MRRKLWTLQLIVPAAAFLLAGAARADDWKWDPKKKATHKVGDRILDEREDWKKSTKKVGVGGQPAQQEKEETTVTLRCTREVVAVDGNTVTEELMKIEKFKLDKKGEDPDTTLEGHTVRVKGKGKGKTWAVEDDPDEKVSDEAKAWLESEVIKSKKRKKGQDKDEKEDDDLPFVPKNPVAPDSEWAVDMQRIAEEFGVDTDADKAHGKGTLTKVTVENGVHVGHVDVKMSLPMKIPTMEWKEGGTMDIAFTVDGSLDEDKSEAHEGVVTIDFTGKGEVKAPQGVVTLEMSLKGKIKMKSTPLDPVKK